MKYLQKDKKWPQDWICGDFIAQRDMTISTYDIGYGDGLFRGDSKSPLIVDRNLPVLGKVSMDYITLETTKVESPYLKMSKQ